VDAQRSSLRVRDRLGPVAGGTHRMRIPDRGELLAARVQLGQQRRDPVCGRMPFAGGEGFGHGRHNGLGEGDDRVHGDSGEPSWRGLCFAPPALITRG
jgi:hypothetical protein